MSHGTKKKSFKLLHEQYSSDIIPAELITLANSSGLQYVRKVLDMFI